MGEGKGYGRCEVTVAIFMWDFLLSVCKEQLSKFKTFDVSEERIDEF